MDERWRGPRDIEEHFDIDDLGTIPIGPPLLTAPEMFAEERLQAARDVQTNILLAAAEQGARILMITSPQPSESRTSFAIDLADLFGRSGHRVLIVDADFTTSLLTRMLAQTAAAHTWTVMTSNEYNDLWVHLRPTPLTNVALLPGRGYSAGAPAMIPSLRWHELVERLLTTADVIIFDGPATLSGPDAALLAPHVDGVVLTLDPATDNREDIAKSKARLLRQKGARLLGAVTFAPAKQRPRLGGVFRQLRGQPMPVLAAPEGAADQNLREIPMLAQQHAPIVTPPPEIILPVVSALDPEITTPAAADLEERPVTNASQTVAQQAATGNRAGPSAGHEQFSAETHRRARRGRRAPREAPGAGATNDESQKA
jgi:Mrp family chromosome partitioning ATPase